MEIPQLSLYLLNTTLIGQPTRIPVLTAYRGRILPRASPLPCTCWDVFLLPAKKWRMWISFLGFQSTKANTFILLAT